MTRVVHVREIPIGGNSPLVLIAGPCVIESETHTLSMAEAIATIAADASVPFVFKTSYDKANRASLSSYRGVGIDLGARILARVRSLGIPVLTDVHEVDHVARIVDSADCIQIPAFLCRQTDLLLEVGRRAQSVNIKKAQFLAPSDILPAIEKVTSTGNHAILITERGTCFGYGNLIVDFRGLEVMRKLGYPLVFDATHSVQPGTSAPSSVESFREFVSPLARAAAAVGIDALFVEVHDTPLSARSDAATCFPLDGLRGLLAEVRAIDAARREFRA